MFPVGHPGRARHHQHPVNPLDSATCTTPATDHQRQLFAACKPHTGARLSFRDIRTPSGSWQSTYQRNDGQRGKHWRNPDMRRNPGVTGGDGWQLRRFDPIDPSSATAICLAEGEKDAATLAAAGLIAFTAPRGAQSLPLADFTELVALAQATGLPVLLCGDRDEVGREAMRKVRRLLKIDLHLDAIDITSLAPENGGSVADLPAEDFLSLIRVNLLDRDPRWQKPIRSRAQYLEYKCPRPKRNIKKAGDLSGICGLGVMRQHGHLPRVRRLGKLPSHRTMLARKASTDAPGLGLR